MAGTAARPPFLFEQSIASICKASAMTGYDSMFDGMTRLALKNSALAKPKQWSSHVSAMSRHTDYGGQAQTQAEPHSASWHSDFMVARAHPKAPVPAYSRGTAGRMNAAQNRAAVQAQLSHRQQLGRIAAAKRTGRAPPNAAHVTDSRNWNWSDGKA